MKIILWISSISLVVFLLTAWAQTIFNRMDKKYEKQEDLVKKAFKKYIQRKGGV